MNKQSLLKILLMMTLLVLSFSFAAAENNRSITVENNSYAIYLGKPHTITAAVENTGEDAPSKTVLIWKSSDENIAKVDNKGKVTGVSAGKAIITVAAEDNESICANVEVEIRIPVKTLTVEPNKAELYIGGTEEQVRTELSCVIVPEDASDKAVVWSSSDDAIATVDQNGNVKAVSKGNAMITAESTDPTGVKKATCKVAVVQAVTGIETDQKEYTVLAPKTIQIKASVSPGDAHNKKLIWSSSDENVATVTDKGAVKGVSGGEAIITAVSADGGNVAVSCKVTVIMPVRKITVEEGNTIILPQGENQRAKVLIEPEDATIKDIVWSSSNEKVATVDQTGMVTAVSNGKAKIIASATDGSNVKGEVNISVETFDIVFRSMASESLELYTTGYGGNNIRAKVKNGAVDVIVSGISTMFGPGGMQNGTTFTINPIKVGSDVITFRYGSSTVKKMVYVAPEAFGMTAEIQDETENASASFDTGSTEELLFMGLQWDLSYPEAKVQLAKQQKELKSPVQSNKYLRAMVDNDIGFAGVSAFRAALNFAYNPDEEHFENNSTFCKGDLYFDNKFSYDEVREAVETVYGLKDGEPSGDSWTWKKGEIKLVLTQKQKFIILEVSKALETEPASEATEETL